MLLEIPQCAYVFKQSGSIKIVAAFSSKTLCHKTTIGKNLRLEGT